MITVLLADDQALVRAGFRSLLDAQDDIEVVGEAGDGESAIRLARELKPDVVLMDIRMPGMDGLEATKRIAADDLLAGVRVVILTTFGLDEYVFEAIRSGASGDQSGIPMFGARNRRSHAGMASASNTAARVAAGLPSGRP